MSAVLLALLANRYKLTNAANPGVDLPKVRRAEVRGAE